MNEGVQRVLAELDRMGYTRDDVVISTNVPVRLDGLPRSDRGEPFDSGAAVYWRTRKGENKVMAIDVYDRVADNLAAVAATLDAMRAIERHGGAVVLDRAFSGFTALPAPGQTVKRDWQDVLGLRSVALPTREQVKAAYRALASMHHPDKGGSEAMMAELNVAQDEALKEIFG
ncbi:J domain-containing protein [Herbaspirillum chlorophenolicum]|uniref:J domain-containing protein n=1 Tax=Herbaspirillum chlorophenolicum TaxID=211589 RepID=UPI0018CD1B5F|nr:J domain-containing protein [Herbaspirillum chlorophenolicum]